ncbi:MAG: phosphatidylglycerol lysyltransferase domain-containing protein [Oscillospiraceae bacterium]|nr:phosphatidylglycerol lysyltransferase domain-containing protein [Oscillospiraceae bacterium]
MWRDFFCTQYAEYNDTLFLKVRYSGREAYARPLGGDLARSLPILLDFCANRSPVLLSPLCAEDVGILRGHGALIKDTCHRDLFDYLYNSSDLREFSGRKYHGQRNHVNRFVRENPNWQFHSSIEGMQDDVMQFLEHYFSKTPPKSAMAAEEHRKTREVFKADGHHGMLVGILTANDRIAAVSAGEIVGDTLFVHIEKGDVSIPGAYPMMVQSFARQYATDEVRYINREEDTGVEGLRKSKLSYHPVKLIEKFSAEIAVK